MKTVTKRILSLVCCLIMAACLVVPAFAGGSVSGNNGYISDGTTTVTSSDIPATLLNRMNVTTIYVPESVTSISAGAFSGLDNLQTVYIDNTAGNVSVAAGALPSGASIVYTGVEETTVAEYTTARHYSTRRYTTTRRATTKATTTEKTTEETTEETTQKETETETELVVYTNVEDVVTDDTSVSAGSKTGRTVAAVAVAVVAVSAVALIVLKSKKK